MAAKKETKVPSVVQAQLEKKGVEKVYYNADKGIYFTNPAKLRNYKFPFDEITKESK